MTITGDNPIQGRGDDVLGRFAMAKTFTQQVLAFDTKSGVVVGVLGPWGSGKTSFVNLAREEFTQAGIPILDFNPWMFSGAEQLVESFFVELAAQLKLLPGLAKVGKGFQEYGEAFSGMGWVPLVGPWIVRASGAAKLLGRVLLNRKEGISGRKATVDTALAKLSKPIVVVLDDIDRLSTAEIRDVFKLVRLTASFPNIVYIVAFDRERVEEALSEQGVPGRAYLEKILQVAVDLPIVPPQILTQQIYSAMDGALADIETPGQFDEQEWPDVFMEIIRPLVRNMRDVRRYAGAIHGTVKGLEGEIALVDVLAIEAVRVFLPDVFKLLHGILDDLTNVGDSRGRSPQIKERIEQLYAAAGIQREVVHAMIERLFPAALRHIGNIHYGGDSKMQWLRERRVAHEDILKLYLERVMGDGLKAFTDAEQAYAYMADHDALDRHLRSLDESRRQDIIASLENFETEFAPEHVVPSTIVLSNLAPELPKQQRGLFALDTRMVVSRVTYRLLRSLKDPDAVERAVSEILPRLKTLSSKMEVIHQVGYREGMGHKLVSEAAAVDFEGAWCHEVISAPVDALTQEPGIQWVLFFAKEQADLLGLPFVIADCPEMTLAILCGAKGESLRQTVGTRAVKRCPQLAWDSLINLYGDEATLRLRVESLMATHPHGVDEVLELAGKYLDGWRPGRFE
jgi:hypothetical protein